MRTLTTPDGCRIAYDVTGAGEAVLLISGLGGLAAFYAGVVPLLATRYRVLGFDHRGTGLSDRPRGGYTIARMAQDAVAVLDAVGIGKAHVVGHSTGGMIAQQLALDHASRVASLVISGSWDRPDARFRAMFEARLAVLRDGGPAAYQMLTHALGYPARYLDAHADALRAAVEQAHVTLSPLPVAAARIEMLLSGDRASELGRIAARALVLAATDDALIPFYHAERLAAAIPGAMLEATEGAHFYPKVDPKRFAASVAQFLEVRHG